jgi:hypothetical protein
VDVDGMDIDVGGPTPVMTSHGSSSSSSTALVVNTDKAALRAPGAAGGGGGNRLSALIAPALGIVQTMPTPRAPPKPLRRTLGMDPAFSFGGALGAHPAAGGGGWGMAGSSDFAGGDGAVLGGGGSGAATIVEERILSVDALAESSSR